MITEDNIPKIRWKTTEVFRLLLNIIIEAKTVIIDRNNGTE